MAPGRSDLQHALGAFLPLDVGEVGQRPGLACHGGLRPRHHLRALEVVGELDERTRREDVDVRGRPGGFRPRRRRADQALSPVIGRNRGRQDAGNRRDRTVERKFAEHGVAGERIGRDRADRRHHGERDRQIVVAPFLGQVGRSKVDRDPLGGQREPGCDQRRPHPLTALGHGLVRQADEDEGDAAGRHLHLNIDSAGLDALERHRRDPRHHSPDPVPLGER